MKVYTDNEIFELQKFGGISRIFQDFLNEGLLEKLTVLPTKQPSLRERIIRKIGLSEIEEQPSFESLIDSTKMDLFHPSYYTNLNPVDLKTPYILTVHDMINELYPEIFDIDRISNSKLRLISGARRIITVSQRTKSDLLDLLDVKEGRVDVIPLYTNFHTITSENPVDEYKGEFMLYVGNRKVYKNFKRFISAILPILERNKDLTVICTGPKFTEAELSYFEYIGFSDRFKSYMCVNDAELKWFYENAVCFVFPSLYEGFGFPLLEAFASGCPVVASSRGSLPEVGGDACIYFDPKDINDMTEKISFVINNKGVQDELVRNGISRLQQYSLSKTLELTRMSYSKAIS